MAQRASPGGRGRTHAMPWAHPVSPPRPAPDRFRNAFTTSSRANCEVTRTYVARSEHPRQTLSRERELVAREELRIMEMLQVPGLIDAGMCSDLSTLRREVHDGIEVGGDDVGHRRRMRADDAPHARPMRTAAWPGRVWASRRTVAEDVTGLGTTTNDAGPEMNASRWAACAASPTKSKRSSPVSPLRPAASPSTNCSTPPLDPGRYVVRIATRTDRSLADAAG